MYQKVTMPALFSWDGVSKNEKVRAIFAEELKLTSSDEGEDEVLLQQFDSGDLSLAESYLLIDEYCKLTKMSTGLYMVLSSFIESGCGINSYVYEYEPEYVDNDTAEFIREKIQDTVFKDIITVERSNVSVEVFIDAPDNMPPEELDYYTNLFYLLEVVHNHSEWSEHYTQRNRVKRDELARRIQLLIDKAIRKFPFGFGTVCIMKNEDIIIVRHDPVIQFSDLPQHILDDITYYNVRIENYMPTKYRLEDRTYPNNPFDEKDWW